MSAEFDRWCREHGRTDPLSLPALNKALKRDGLEPVDLSRFDEIAQLEQIPVLDEDP